MCLSTKLSVCLSVCLALTPPPRKFGLAVASAMNLRLHGAACASLAPNACVVHHLGASQLAFDSAIGAARIAVRFRESLQAKVWPRSEGRACGTGDEADELCGRCEGGAWGSLLAAP